MPPTVSIVIPVFQSAAHLSRCLAALAVSTVSPLETIVVDDGSTDRGGDVAVAAGAIVLRVADGPRGPATARNLGAAHAHGDILLFLDADVAVHRDTLAGVVSCFDEHPEVAALFGSYDDRPEHRTRLSQYRNLLHHYVHHQGRREASTFWAGCGAVRRSIFASLGGFDERYARPSVEDIELGGRLRSAGHTIWLCPNIQVTHLKRWTFRSIVTSDIRDRAIPWTQLILRDAHLPKDLNVDVRSRLSALAAWVGVAAGLGALAWPRAGWVAAIAAVALVGLNLGLYRFFLRKRGLLTTLVAAGMHTLYLLYSSAVFAVLSASAWQSRSASREP